MPNTSQDVLCDSCWKKHVYFERGFCDRETELVNLFQKSIKEEEESIASTEKVLIKVKSTFWKDAKFKVEIDDTIQANRQSKV